MNKRILIFGLIAGVLSCIGYLMELLFDLNMSLEAGMAIGFASMLAGFSLIFVAIVKDRKDSLTTRYTFSRAFLIGLGVSFIASTIYVLVWMIYFEYGGEEFIDVYSAKAIAELKKGGFSPDVLQQKIEEQTQSMRTYKTNAFYRIGITYTEIFPIGLLVSIIAGLILKRKGESENEEVLDSKV